MSVWVPVLNDDCTGYQQIGSGTIVFYCVVLSLPVVLGPSAAARFRAGKTRERRSRSDAQIRLLAAASVAVPWDMYLGYASARWLAGFDSGFRAFSRIAMSIDHRWALPLLGCSVVVIGLRLANAPTWTLNYGAVAVTMTTAVLTSAHLAPFLWTSMLC